MAVRSYSQGIEGAQAAPRGRVRIRRYVLRQYAAAYLFILPVLLLYGVFVLRPALQTFWLALYEWNGISADREWVGLANFRRLFDDPIFWQAFRHSLTWTAVVVTFNLTVGLVAAALLASNIRGRLLFQLGFFLPVVQASIVTAMIWRWIYAPTGVLNSALETVGLDVLTRGWLGDFNLALPALAAASSWMTFGLSVVILLALVDSFKVFDIIWATTEGGPIRSTEVLGTYLFKEGIQKNQYGYGSAIAVALALIILASSFVNLVVRERGDD